MCFVIKIVKKKLNILMLILFEWLRIDGIIYIFVEIVD